MLLEQNWNAVPGGTARATNRLVEALLAHTNVDLVGVHGIHKSGPNLDLPTGMEINTVPVPGRALAESWSRFDRVSLDRWVSADVVHAPAYVMAKTSAAKVVTIHDLAFVRHPEWFTPNGVRYFTRFLERVRQSDAVVIAPSHATANDCIARGIDQDRVHTIGWGVDTSVASAGEVAEVVARYALPEQFVLFVGTVEPRKNLTTLIDAMEGLGDVPLVVVGPAGWGDIVLGDALVLGHVPDADIGPLMAAATVLAYPSHFEGFGLPVLEAMAQGTPVLVTRGTAPSELAGDAGVAVDTHSATEIREALHELLGSPTDRAALGAVGSERAATFRWDHVARAHVEIYESLV